MRYRVYVLVIGLLLSGCVLPEGGTRAIHLEAQGTTQYNHRGMVNNERGALQGEAAIDLETLYEGNLSLRTWGNMDVSNSAGNAWFPDGQGGKFSEIDLTAELSRQFGPIAGAVGVVSYILPKGQSFPLAGERTSTTEVFTWVSTELFPDSEIFAFQPTLRANFDFDEADGHYLHAEVSKVVVLPASFFTKLSAGIGYSDANQSEWTYGTKDAGFSDVSGNVTVGYAYDSRTTLFVGAAGSSIIDDDIRDWFDVIDVDNDNVWVFLGASWDL